MHCSNRTVFIEAGRGYFKCLFPDVVDTDETCSTFRVLGPIIAPGALPSLPAFTVKVHAKYPSNPAKGRPGIQGVIHLLDVATGELLALIDSPQLTAHRTAAAGAVAADVLARHDANSVAIVGAGVQGEMQFAYLTHVWHIDRIWAFDVNPEAAHLYAKRRQAEGYRCEMTTTVEKAVQTPTLSWRQRGRGRPF